MSEKSDLRERAREWTTACRTIDLNEHEKEGVGIMLDLLAALDAAEREERERCVRVVESEMITTDGYHVKDHAYNMVCRHIAAAIRRERGRDE